MTCNTRCRGRLKSLGFWGGLGGALVSALPAGPANTDAVFLVLSAVLVGIASSFG